MNRSLVFLSLWLIPALGGCSANEKDAIVPANMDGGKPPSPDSGPVADTGPAADTGPGADTSPPEAAPDATGNDAVTTTPDMKPASNIIWDPATARGLLVHDRLGGLVGPYVCTDIHLDVPTKVLTATSCNVPPAHAPRSRTLTTAEFAQVNTAMAGLTLSARMDCGADKPMWSLEVETTAGAKTTYLDSFYSCQRMGKYVDNIDAVMTTVRNLAQ